MLKTTRRIKLRSSGPVQIEPGAMVEREPNVLARIVEEARMADKADERRKEEIAERAAISKATPSRRPRRVYSYD